MERNYVYVFQSPYSTVSVVNYNAENTKLNEFLALFDVWNSKGQKKVSVEDRTKTEVWFEFSKDAIECFRMGSMELAIKRLGAEIVFEYPFTM